MKNPVKLLFPRTEVAVIRLQGVIATGRGLGTPSLSDAGLAPLIERAFRAKPAAVALAVNSPGGSPVQSALIAARIRRLAEEHHIPVHAFAEDVAASGGYWLLTAGDTIHADANSIIGSIGVISAGFGLQDLIARWGVERRVHTAGKSKSMLDPFRPEKPEDVKRLRRIFDVIHGQFIAQVKTRRGARLARDRDLFTGEVWTGEEALLLGLIDGLGHLVPVIKGLYGDKVRLIPYGQKRSLFQRLGGPGAADLLAAVDDRSLWARFGL